MIYLASCNIPMLTEPVEPKSPPVQLPETVTGKAYYISKDGDDANPGTIEKSLRSLEKLNTINLEPGEIVYLEGGTTFSGTLKLDIEDSGSKGLPVVITSYGQGPAIIDGDTKISAIINSSYFKLINYCFTTIILKWKCGKLTSTVLIKGVRFTYFHFYYYWETRLAASYR